MISQALALHNRKSHTIAHLPQIQVGNLVGKNSGMIVSCIYQKFTLYVFVAIANP